MRAGILVIILVVATPWGTATSEPPSAVRIAEIHPDPDAGPEFIEIWNHGDTPVNLEGWRIADARRSYDLPDYQLAPNERLPLWSGPGSADHGYTLTGARIWNNDGDNATLTDAVGETLHRTSYGRDAEAPAPPANTSVHWTTDGWVVGNATPGQRAPSHSHVDAHASVQDVPAVVTFRHPPTLAVAGAPLAVPFTVADPNNEPASWRLIVAGQTVAQGNAGDHAPVIRLDGPGAHRITVATTDGEASIIVDAVASPWRVTAGNLGFPTLTPGARNLTTPWFNLTNLGSAATPFVDVANLTGPGIIPASHMAIELNDRRFTLGGLTPLTVVESGQTVRARLVVAEVPGVPAGDYATSVAFA